MADKWFAECLPCKWETQHDDEDSAIRAAVKHVNALHADIPPEVRGDKKIGHVQNRTVGALATQLSPAPAPDTSGTGSSDLATTGASSPAPEQSNVVNITTPKGETITVKE